MAKRFDTGSGPSQRQLRVGEIMRHALAEVLARGEIHDPVLQQHVVTVPEVRMSPDLKIATCFVMPLGGQATSRRSSRRSPATSATCAASSPTAPT